MPISVNFICGGTVIFEGLGSRHDWELPPNEGDYVVLPISLAVSKALGWVSEGDHHFKVTRRIWKTRTLLEAWVTFADEEFEPRPDFLDA